MELGPFEVLDPKNPDHKDSSKYVLYPGDVLEHTILALEKLPKGASDELLLATLFHDIGKPATYEVKPDRIHFNGHDTKGVEITYDIMRRLKFSNEAIERVCALVGNHMRFAVVDRMKLSKIKRFITMPHFDEHMALHTADCLASHGSLENIDFVKQKLIEIPVEELKPARIVTGKDLIELGFKPGPKFREILDDIEDRQLEGSIKTREEAIEFIKKYYLAV